MAMRFYDKGSTYGVTVGENELYEWKQSWPASGLGSRPIFFEFEKRNGDLVDTEHPGSEDGEALKALSEDAQKWGEEVMSNRGIDFSPRYTAQERKSGPFEVSASMKRRQFKGLGDTMQTMSDFVRKYGITMKCQRRDSNPNMAEGGRSMDHWLCKLKYTPRYAGQIHTPRQMSIHYSMGQGLGGREPEPEDVLNSMALDASGFINARDFYDWCAEYGYEPQDPETGKEDKKVMKIYQAVERERDKLYGFLVGEMFEELLYKTESL